MYDIQILKLHKHASCPRLFRATSAPRHASSPRHVEVFHRPDCPQVRIPADQGNVDHLSSNTQIHTLRFSASIYAQRQCRCPALCSGRTPDVCHCWNSVCGCGCNDSPEPCQPSVPVKPTHRARGPAPPNASCEEKLQTLKFTLF